MGRQWVTISFFYQWVTISVIPQTVQLGDYMPALEPTTANEWRIQKWFKGLLISNTCVISVTCYTCRPYGVHPVSAGQFPVRWGAGGAQCGATLHCIWIPKPNDPMAEGWSAITRRLPLDAAHHRPHRFRLEARGQRQLHLWGHQQLRLQRGDRSPQRHRWVKIWRVYSTVIKYLLLIPMTTPLSHNKATVYPPLLTATVLHWQLQMEKKSEMDRGNECDVRSWTGTMETSFKLCWLCPGPVPHTCPPPRLQPALVWAEQAWAWSPRTARSPPLCSQTSARLRNGDGAEQQACRSVYPGRVRGGGKDRENFIMPSVWMKDMWGGGAARGEGTLVEKMGEEGGGEGVWSGKRWS